MKIEKDGAESVRKLLNIANKEQLYVRKNKLVCKYGNAAKTAMNSGPYSACEQ